MRVLVTRAARGASALAEALQALGLEPVLLPAISTIEPHSFAVLDQALERLDQYQWLLFTSATAVEAFAARRRMAELPSSLRIAAIGPATARALDVLGRTPDLVPVQAVAESLTEALLPFARQPDGTPTRFFLPRAEEARDHLPDTLRSVGADVTIAPAYRTVIPPESVALAHGLFSDSSVSLDAITFTSASTVRNLLALCETAAVTLPPDALRISIGPVTSQALRDDGFPPHAESPEASVQTLAQTTRAALTRRHHPL